jgi:tetratricopeptide (TPR) repeat protein
MNTPTSRARPKLKMTRSRIERKARGRSGAAASGLRELEKTTVVTVRKETIVLPTYLPAAPDKNPMFLEKRVYQGSSGKVYPLPFTDRIAEKPVERQWKAIWIENEFLRALVLPELGGRIHVLQDKTNGYELIYNQHVIKPALVGLAGPWVSGGIEFNWPQHHRPATFLPVDFEVEAHEDGSRTIWCSDHDPMSRMKGMHGVCLHPGKAYLELKVRAYNRTPFTQTFLWWANVATRVHESYQSFFPPDVYYVAEHARRSMSQYPLAKGFYYGVNYGERGQKGVPKSEVPSQFVPLHCRDNSETRNAISETPTYAPNDLSFYANIPVPTSYMCMGSQENFFGGYDYKARAGLVHYANHHISPGKKQWTWGNDEFGYAWDRNLTEPDACGEYGPYIEIMAGVYTDNQPDFSFLQPGETKTWSQYWYPIQQIGAAQHASLDGALSLHCDGGRRTAAVQIGVAVTVAHRTARVILERVLAGERKDGGIRRKAATRKTLARFTCDLAPGKPFTRQLRLPHGLAETDLQLRVTDASGRELLCYTPEPRVQGEVPPPATEPPAPAEIASADELYLTGLHLEQYRHATRSPMLYWSEALRRDPLDARCNNAVGLWYLKRGEFTRAEKHFRNAVERLTRRNPNPSDGEAYYNLGLCLRRLGRNDDAYAAFYKATWNQGWAAAGYHALAEIDSLRQQWATALEHLDRSLRLDTDHLRARNLKVLVLRKLGEPWKADALLQETRRLDRLDWWARHLEGEKPHCDLQTLLDLAHDYARAGFYAEAIGLLTDASFSKGDLPDQNWGALPLVHYTLGWLEEQRGQAPAALRRFKQAALLSPDYCFPSRLEEIAILESAIRRNPGDPCAPYYLGNLLYDRRRHEEAIRLWERAARLDPSFSVVWRNLGIGYFNIRRKALMARTLYDKAFRANPADARLLLERDQLWKRLGEKPKKRLHELEKHLDLVQQRDDLCLELCALYNQTGQPVKAMQLIGSRQFQPWEGGEGGPLGQHVRAQLALGRSALAHRDFGNARAHFEHALTSPRNLSEAKHLLANQSDIHYWLGCACAGLADAKSARRHWLAAATFKGDFQEMSVRAFSEMTYYSALAWEKLRQRAKAKGLLRRLFAYAQHLQKAKATIPYFATSLPTMLLFDDDLSFRQETTALFLQAQAWLGLGQKARGMLLLRQVLRRDPNHALARDLQAEGLMEPKTSPRLVGRLQGGKLIGLKRNGGNGHELPEAVPAVREEYSREGNGDGENLLPLAIIVQIGDER